MLKHSLKSKVTVGLLTLLALSGCATVPLDQVTQFGETTVALSSNTKGAINYLDRIEVDRKIHRVAANPEAGPTRQTFETFFQSTSEDGDGADKKRALSVRLKLLSGLSNYATALSDIASAQHYEDINAASADLNTSLVGLSATYMQATGSDIGMSSSELGFLATLVNAWGRSKINKIQISALKRIVPAADPHIQKAAELIEKDFGADGPLSDYATQSVTSVRRSMQKAYLDERAGPDSSYAWRLAKLKEIEQYNKIRLSMPTFFSDVSASAKKMATSHAALSKALQDDSLNNADFANSLAEFKSQVEAVQEFRESLKD